MQIFLKNNKFKFCDTLLWDESVTGLVDGNYTVIPDFTSCFHNSFLQWIPCFLLWILTPSWIYMLSRGRNYITKFTWLSYTKFTVYILLIIIQISILVKTIIDEIPFYVYYVTPCILILAYITVIVLTYFEIRNGLSSSVLMFLFWGSLLLLSTFTFRTKIMEYDSRKSDTHMLKFVLFYENYTLILIIFVLTFFSEKKIVKKPFNRFEKLKAYPESSASLLSRILFLWINPMITNGSKKKLTKQDMWQIDETESCELLTSQLEEEWNELAQKYITENRVQYEKYKYELKLQENAENAKIEAEFVSLLKAPSLTKCLINMFYGKFLAGTFMKLLADLFQFAGPILLDALIVFINNKNQDPIIGYFLAVLMLFVSIVQSLLTNHYFHRMLVVGARVRTALMGLIYKKSMRLSTESRKKATIGEMVNLLQVNTQSFMELTVYINNLWSAPLQIIVSVIILWSHLGIASLAGVIMMFIFVPVNIALANRSKILKTQKLKYQDARIKTTTEILNGIKVLKFYGWEKSFNKIVDKIREIELQILSKFNFVSTFISFGWGAVSFLVTTSSFIVYILIDENNVLTAQKAFVSLTLFNIIRLPLMFFPETIGQLIQASVSMTRIREFLLRDEIDESQITRFDNENKAIELEDANLSWSETDTEMTLKNINLNVKKGELVAIIGEVGSGKTSLLSCLLGEMNKFKGKINLNGSLAYVPQQAWIQNATLKNNILFGNEYNESFYNQVIKSCALLTDLNILPAGDSTEIGEKGINLSGGQKQRISLARAVYSNSDIIILDDPLSAVDAHVGKHIFDSVISHSGILHKKTRLFATNSLSFLPECDRIIMLKDGEIKEVGAYEQLKKIKDGVFNEFIGKHLENYTNKEEEKPELKKMTSVKDKVAEPKNNNSKVGETLIVQENVETGKVKFAVLKEYFSSCSLSMSFIFILLICLSNAVQAGNSFWLDRWTKNINNNTTQYVDLGVYSGLGLLQCILVFFGDLVFVKMVMKSSMLLHSQMLYSIFRSSMHFFESTPIGRIINRFSKDIDSVEFLIPASYRMLIRTASQVIITILIISIKTPFFLIAVVPITIIYVFCQRYYVTAMRQLRRLNSVTRSPTFSHFGETISGVSTVRAYKVQDRFIDQMNYKIDENLLYYYPETVSYRWLSIRLELIGNLITFLSALFAIISRDTLDGSDAGLSISSSLSIAIILNWMVRMSAEFESNITSVERIKEYCQTDYHEAPWIVEDAGPSSDWPSEGNVDFVNYSVKYREELDFVLKDININIKSTEKIGVVGRTGAGKSSLTLGLFRILESNYGKIFIDNIDIKKIGLHDLRNKLTIIPQDPVIFSGTLRINLDPFENYSDEQIWTALKNAHLFEFVQNLDKQLQFECSEGGENLSIGQRQLICLARALLRKTKILILDEATAAIDHNTDDLIQKTIRESFADCTVITIAHRLNTILDSTRILVLDKGQIIEFDSPKRLLKNKNSLFYSMAASANLV